MTQVAQGQFRIVAGQHRCRVEGFPTNSIICSPRDLALNWSAPR